MALRAGYYGLKKSLLNKVKGLPGIKSIGSGLSLNSTTGELTATGTTVAIEANPEGSATDNLVKLGIGEDIYAVPDAAKTYQTDDATESAIVDADYIPFLDSSAASGSGAPKKSTWSNFKSKLKMVFDALYMTWEANAKTGVHNQADLSKTGGSTGLTISDITDNGFTIGFPTGSYPATRTPLDLIVGEQYTLSFKCVSTTNNNVKGGIRDNDSLFKITAGPLVAGTSYSVDFTYAAGDKIVFFINGSADSTSTAVITDVVVKPKEDTSNLVTPFAMTNRELTEALNPIEGTPTSDFTYNTANSQLYKVGKVVHCTMRINDIDSATAWTTVLATLPQGFRPKGTDSIIVPAYVSGGAALVSISGYDGTVKANENITSSNIIFSASWITD